MKNSECNNGNIHLMGVQEKYRADVSLSAQKALDGAAQLLQFSRPIDVAIFDAEDWDVHPELDLAARGRVYYIDIKICFYRKNLNIQNVFEKELPATIYHEMAHVVRANTVGYAETLLEDFIEEGIACVVEESLGWDRKIPYIFPIKNEEKWVEEAKKLYTTKLSGKLHDEWFFGAGTIPEWAGYRIGYLLVTNFLKNNPLSLDKLVRMKAAQIVEK